MPLSFELTFYPWITQAISGSVLAQAVRRFAAVLEPALASALGQQVSLIVLPELDIPDQLAHIRTPPSGRAGKIALMNPIGYALTHESCPVVECLAVVRRRIGDAVGPTYKSQIYTSVQSGIHSIKQLRKRTFAFGSPQSTSNFLVPAHVLWRNGLHPMNAFTRLDFAGGHDLAARAVYEGRVDAAAGHDGVILDLAHKQGYGDAGERLVRIEWSEPIPSDPIAAHIPDAAMRLAVKRALLSIARPDDASSPGNAAITRFWGTAEGLESITPDGYRGLLRYVTELALRADDLLLKW
jgi:phosphate/phosphite/phosphonate ABC transporter binding protein